MTVTLEVFGALSIEVRSAAGTRSISAPDSEQRVLAYLTLHPGRQRRDNLRERLALNQSTLRSALKRLRAKELDRSGILVVDPGEKYVELRLDPDNCSLHRFRKECLSDDPDDREAAWLRSEAVLFDESTSAPTTTSCRLPATKSSCAGSGSAGTR